VATPYLSEIKLFAFAFPPKGWALCQGQLLPINQNQALFALLGTTYGGNGVTTFALPDLRGRAPISFGQGGGLQNYVLGQQGGIENETLALTEMPLHTHVINTSQVTATLPCKNAVAQQRGPSGNVPAIEASGVTATYSSAAADSSGSTGAIVPTLSAGNTGGGQAHANLQPYTVLNYCIALQGIFPSQV
jgi:microcystin-dependent protein